MGTTSKVDESGYIQLSYTEYNRIQQKKIDSSSNETMFRQNVPNNMLPTLPKPILIPEDPPEPTLEYENHMTDVEYENQR